MTVMELGNGDKLKFIGCEIAYREACRLAATSPFRVDVQFLRKGLHDLPTGEMRSRLQQAVDSAAAEADYKAILLGYARCNDGVVGLKAPSVPLVIPKAHDCITFFFGSRHAYQQYFYANPGTYFHTTGWLERNDSTVPGAQGVMAQLGLGDTYEQMVAKYGRDNAEFIRQTLGDGLQNYSKICYIEMDATDERPFLNASRLWAEQRGWQFERLKGDWSLLERLFAGQWDKDFLLVGPGLYVASRNDDEVLGVCEEAVDC
ncbi:MAG: DUF1638 domain-containing protein [Planctomycetes bacterium]|nr:DUF1638 domain-containing protein [Planctomycetota bacterium]